MQPRILLFTGKGGVGKTTTAAGTAALAARAGHRTLVMSTDAAHSLGDAFARELDHEPTEVEDRLWVHQVDSQRRFERSWTEIQDYLMRVLSAVGVDPIAAEELTVVPGAEEVLALLELREHARSGRWDAIVVDCAPTAETLRLLALPEALSWYMDRIFGVQRRVVTALRPVLTRAAGVPMPGDAVFSAVERLHHELEEVRTILTRPQSTVRLVLTPERMVLAEARRSLTTLSLYGYAVDGVVANRVFPSDADDPWRKAWVEAQQSVLQEVAQSFAGMPVWQSPYLGGEPIGVGPVAALVEATYAGSDPLARPDAPEPMGVSRAEHGAELRIALPLASREAVDLVRKGDELVVTVDSYRRILALPAALARLQVVGARVDGGTLQVRFAGTAEGARE